MPSSAARISSCSDRHSSWVTPRDGVDREAKERRCPRCSGRLDWVEQGTIGGTRYDYYRWCLKGCGLYCYDATAGQWVKLA